MGYGFGGLFRTVARAVISMVKSGAQALGKIDFNAGAGVLKEVASGRNLRPINSRRKEAVNVAKEKSSIDSKRILKRKDENVQIKKERHRRQQIETNRPRNGEKI